MTTINRRWVIYCRLVFLELSLHLTRIKVRGPRARYPGIFSWRLFPYRAVVTNRKIAYIVKDQKPLVLRSQDTVKRACQLMNDRRAGSVLVVDDQNCLRGIFTGRDAVRILAGSANPATIPLARAMTAHPSTISPDCRAIDALRIMSDGGFRHLPVIEGQTIWGVVSRADFKGMEIDQLEEEDHLWECIR